MDLPVITVNGFYPNFLPVDVAQMHLFTNVHRSLLMGVMPEDIDERGLQPGYQIQLNVDIPEHILLEAVMAMSAEEHQPTQGVSPEVLARLRQASSKACKRTKFTPNDCCICMEHVKRRFILPCGHVFHRKCVHTWFEEHQTCPVCRTNVEEGLNASNTQ